MPMLARTALAGSGPPERTDASASRRLVNGCAQNSPSRTPMPYGCARWADTSAAGTRLTAKLTMPTRSWSASKRAQLDDVRQSRPARIGAGSAATARARRARADPRRQWSRTRRPARPRRAGSACRPRAGPGRRASRRPGRRRVRARSLHHRPGTAAPRPASRRARPGCRCRTVRTACGRTAPDSRWWSASRDTGAVRRELGRVDRHPGAETVRQFGDRLDRPDLSGHVGGAGDGDERRALDPCERRGQIDQRGVDVTRDRQAYDIRPRQQVGVVLAFPHGSPWCRPATAAASRFIASVVLRVKITWSSGRAPTKSAIDSRASSYAWVQRRDAAPAPRCTLAYQGSSSLTASATAARHGAVAA